MMIGILAMLCGIGIYALWNHTEMPRGFRRSDLGHWIRKDLGRYGVSGFYFVAGLLVFLRGYFGMRMEERSKNPVSRM
jgi:hypothetical protein